MKILKDIFNRFGGSFAKTDLSRRFAGAAFWSFAGAASQKILLLGTSFLCMYILGKAGYGKLSIVRSTIQIFVLFGAVGMGSTATKYIAEFRDKDPARLTGIYSIVNLFAFSAGVLATAAILCFAHQIADYLKDPQLVNTVRIGALLLFFSIINSIQTGILTGLEKFREIAAISALGGIVEFVCIILGSVYFSVIGALLGYGIGFLFLTVMNQYAIGKCRCPELHFSRKAVNVADTKELLFFSIPLLGSSLLVSPVMWLSQSLLVRYGDFSELGVYAAADQWRMVLLFIPSALSRIVLPMLSNLNGKDSVKSYLKVLKINLYVNAGTTFLFLLLFLAVLPVILMCYRLSSSCYLIFAVLAGSTFFSSLAAVFGQAITSQGKTWIGLWFNLGWGVMVIVSTVLFLHLGLGALALALGMLTSYLLHTLFQGFYFIYFLKNYNKGEAR